MGHRGLCAFETFSVGSEDCLYCSRGKKCFPRLDSGRLGGDWVRLVGVDAEILDGFVDEAALDFAVLE